MAALPKPIPLPSTSDNLPRGLRHLGSNEYLVQLSREGQRLTKRVHGTRAEALRALEGAKVELGKRLAGATPSPRASSGPSPHVPPRDCPTLADFLSECGRYANYQLRKQSERTRRKLVAPIRYLVASDLGPMPLDSIRATDVNDYIAWRLQAGALTFATRKDGQQYAARVEKVSAVTVNKSLRVLSSALHFAQREGLIDAVPPIDFLPESNAKRVRGPSKEDFEKVLAAAELLRPEAPWLPEVIELVSEFALRPGEVMSLTWASVDFAHKGNGTNRGCIHVEEQQHVSFVPKEGKRRLVPMTPRGREVLEKLRARTPVPMPTDFVVPNRHGLPYIRLDVPGMKGGGAGVWKKLQKLSGVHVTMYSLRHYWAEQTLTAGVPLHIASRWMGHSKVELTSKRYGDFAPDNAAQWDWVGARAGG